MRKNIKEIGTKKLIFFAVITVVSMLIAMFSTSPISQAMGWDSAIFMTMGNLITEGGTLYIDLFDHKGPVLFFINSIPQFFIDGPIGIWVLEVIVMFISLLLLYKCAFMVLKNKSAIFVPVVYLILMSFSLEGGNFSEEYCNLFCIIGLYIYVKFVESGNKQLTNFAITILGVLFSLILFTRINNAVLLLAVIGCIGLHFLIYDRKRLLTYIVFGILGILIIAVPICLFFYSQSSLDEMLNATIFFNFDYSDNADSQSFFSFLAKITTSVFGLGIYSITLFGVASSVYGLIKKDFSYGFFNLIYTVVALFAVCLAGNDYFHYIVISVPSVAISVMILLKHLPIRNFFEKWHVILVVVSLVGLAGASILPFFVYPEGKTNIDYYRTHALEMLELIPEDERDSVFGYHIEPKWYPITNIIPCGKYFVLQEFWALVDESITEDMNDMFTNDPPKWLVVSPFDPVTNPVVLERIENDYEYMLENLTGTLYRLKD